MHIHNKIHVSLSTLSCMFRRLWRQFWAYGKVLPEDSAIIAETCRGVLIIIHSFYCICAFCCWHIKDISTENFVVIYIHSFIHSLVFSLRGRVGRNQSPGMWPIWLWHTASWASSWGSLPLLSPAFRRSHFRRQVPVRPQRHERS